MKSDYKRLGNYIEAVNRRNVDCKVTDLRGLSLTKEFRSSTSNIVGTDMSTYKIMHKYDFAANFMGLGVLVDKAAIVLKLDDKPNIVSGAYPVFKVKDENELHPEYLMMWLIRPEFDRFCVFKSDRGIRGGFDWNDLLEVQLPIPHITKQREIVKEYNTIQNRIALNQQLIQKLEETAQAIYKQWFVEGIDMENLPEGWRAKSFTEVVNLSGGGTPDTSKHSFWNGKIPFFTPADISDGYYSIQTEKYITESGLNNSSTKLYPKNTVFVTARGTVGAIAIAGSEMAMNQSCYALSGDYPFFIHQLTIETMNKLKTEAVGAVFGALVTKDFEAQIIIDPTVDLKKEFDNKVSKIYDFILLKINENQKLTELKELLLSRLASV